MRWCGDQPRPESSLGSSRTSAAPIPRSGTTARTAGWPSWPAPARSTTVSLGSPTAASSCSRTARCRRGRSARCCWRWWSTATTAPAGPGSRCCAARSWRSPAGTSRRRDTRGWDPALGWLHAVAHGADLVGALAGSPRLGRADLRRLLDLLVDRATTPTTLHWLQNEDDRVAVAMMAVLRRDLLDGNDVRAAVDRLAAAWRTAGSGSIGAQTDNAVRLGAHLAPAAHARRPAGPRRPGRAPGAYARGAAGARRRAGRRPLVLRATGMSDPLEPLRRAAADRAATGMQRTLRPRPARDDLLDLASNDYLGLARDPRRHRCCRSRRGGWGAGLDRVSAGHRQHRPARRSRGGPGGVRGRRGRPGLLLRLPREPRRGDRAAGPGTWSSRTRRTTRRSSTPAGSRGDTSSSPRTATSAAVAHALVDPRPRAGRRRHRRRVLRRRRPRTARRAARRRPRARRAAGGRRGARPRRRRPGGPGRLRAGRHRRASPTWSSPSRCASRSGRRVGRCWATPSWSSTWSTPPGPSSSTPGWRRPRRPARPRHSRCCAPSPPSRAVRSHARALAAGLADAGPARHRPRGRGGLGAGRRAGPRGGGGRQAARRRRPRRLLPAPVGARRGVPAAADRARRPDRRRAATRRRRRRASPRAAGLTTCT